MIYLQKEREAFAETLEEFEATYIKLLENLLEVFRHKAATRDSETPIHHRMSPQTMLSLAQAKTRRVETLMSGHVIWWEEEGLLDKIIEECGDIANYSLYIAALCVMLKGEEQ